MCKQQTAVLPLEADSELGKVHQEGLKPLLVQAMLIWGSSFCRHIICALVVESTSIDVGDDDVW